MFEKLLDFDEICLEGTVVEKKRRVSPRGEVFEFSRLPGEAEGVEHMTWLFDSIILISCT